MLSDTFKFSSLCSKILENLSLQSKKARRTSILTQFFSYLHAKDQSDPFPFLRLLLCPLDSERRIYRLQEKKLAKLYIGALGISSTSPLGDALIHYRQPSPLHSSAGDFPSVLSQCLSSREPTAPTSITITETNRLLDLLASSDTPVQVNVIGELLLKLSALEHKWICRIILKDLRLRMIKPMLAKRTSLAAVYSECFSPGDPLVVERKLDGERVQIHALSENSEIKVFSRGCLYVERYSKQLSDLILGAVDCDNCILDGELLVYNKTTKKFEEFGSLKVVAGEAEEGNLNLCCVVFDVLYLNNESLLNVPWVTRREKLECVVKKVPTRLQVIETCHVSNHEELTNVFNQFITDAEEGAIVKAVNSEYKPGGRDSDWIKLKPDYEIGVLSDLDCVLIGGSFGHHQRSQQIASIHLGVLDPQSNQYVLVARVGGGLSDLDRRELTTKLKSDHFSEVSTDSIPNNGFLNFGEFISPDDRPNFVVDDINSSFIVTVTASQISTSKVYPLGYTLRFPRVTRIRTASEKAVADCMTVDDFSELISTSAKSGGRLFSGQENSQDPEAESLLYDDSMNDVELEIVDKKPKEKTRKKPRKIKRKFSKLDPLRSALTRRAQIEVESDLFNHLELMIEIRSTDYDYLWEKLLANGAKVVENPTNSLSMIVIDHPVHQSSPSVQLVSQTRSNVDFVHPDYFELCLSHSELLPLSPIFVYKASQKTEHEILPYFDRFGDSFIYSVEETFLQKIFQKIGNEYVDGNHSFLENERQEISSFFDNFKFFSGVSCFFHPQSVSLSLLIEFYGGQSKSTMSDCSHVVISSTLDTIENVINEAKLRKLNNGTICPPTVVSSDWIHKCIEERTVISEEEFIIKEEEMVIELPS
ncbi:hypothetical protein GEMRC1_003426 [Eukaryota sp. GEM-RC1]